MANPNIPFGFLDNGLMDGTMPTFGSFEGTVSHSNANKIYGGDVAKPPSGGFYDVFTAAVGGGETVGGIFLPSFAYLSLSQGMRSRNRFWLGQTGDVSGGDVSAKLVISKDNVFKVRTAGLSGGSVGASAIGQTANFAIGPAPGNNGISAFWLDDSTLGSNPAQPFVVYALAQAPETDPTSQYNIVYVRFNNLQQP